MIISKWFCVAALLCSFLTSCSRSQEEVPQVDRTKSKMSYIDNGIIRLGVDLNVGGAVTHLSELSNGENLINSSDWGRQIQMSFYSGPIPFEPNGKKPMSYWKGLGWNPIQSGDSYAHGSRVLEHKNEGNKLYIKSIPMQWPLDNEPGECTFECWFELEGNVVKCHNRLVNSRIDKTQYEGRDQELPAVYLNGRWSKMFTYTGDKPFTNAPLEEIVHIWDGGPTNEPWDRWYSTERWAALVDQSNRGPGIWSPETTFYAGGYVGQIVGSGGEHDKQSNYVSPLQKEILDHNIKHDYSYRLIVGSLKEIRDYVYNKTPRIVSPDYQFESSRDGWVYKGSKDSGWPIKGSLDIQLSSAGNLITGPFDFWRGQDIKKIYIRAALTSKNATCKLLWKTAKDAGFVATKEKSVKMIGDGKFRVYEVDLTDYAAYKSGILQIALKLNSARNGDSLKIDYISYKK